jgi:hypothetical protein
VNENQAAELANGTIVVNAREIDDKRALCYSFDGGITFPVVRQATTLRETFQGSVGATFSWLAPLDVPRQV